MGKFYFTGSKVVWVILVFFLYAMLNADRAGPTGKHTNMNGRSDLPWTHAVYACMFNPLYSHSIKWHVERKLGESALKATPSAADSLMTSVH